MCLTIITVTEIVNIKTTFRHSNHLTIETARSGTWRVLNKPYGSLKGIKKTARGNQTTPNTYLACGMTLGS